MKDDDDDDRYHATIPTSRTEAEKGQVYQQRFHTCEMTEM